jgi:gamma-glutamylcysteine synthetase
VRAGGEDMGSTERIGVIAESSPAAIRVERATRIELAFSAWEAIEPLRPDTSAHVRTLAQLPGAA